MKLVTQDGRELNLDRKYRLHVWTFHSENPTALTISLEGEAKQIPSKIRYYSDGEWRENPSFYWRHEVILKEEIGNFETQTSRDKVAAALREAWKNGAEEFVVPEDNFAKSDEEKFNDFCEEHGLTLATINELGYSRQDIPYSRHIWRTTSDFERRGILVADPNADIDEFGGVYSTSLKKWQALGRATA